MSYPQVKETAIPGLSSYNICGTRFLLDAKYAPIKFVGYGSYGVLVAAKDTTCSDDTFVVIEKVENAFSQPSEIHSLLTEITLSKELRHPNIVAVLEVLQPQGSAPCTGDLYLVFERMAVDLRECKRATPLDSRHVAVLAYQILLALHQLHAAGIAHGEVRPSNILIDEEFNAKVSKCGQAVQVGAATPVQPQTLEQPLWYYAPEVLSGETGYSTAADVWSAGMVILETICRKHLIKGRTAPQVLASLCAVLGSGGDAAPDAGKVKESVQALLPDAASELVDLLVGMLQFDPAQRISAQQALQHAVFADVKGKFPALTTPAACSLPMIRDEEALKEALLKEVVRQMPQA